MYIFQIMEDPLRKRGRYVNPHTPKDRRSFFEFLRWKTGYYKYHNPDGLRPTDFFYPNSAIKHESHRPAATWIGHSSYLIEWDGFNLLTDPIFNEYCAPIPIQGLKRKSETPFTIEQLPKIDLVLISHNHYDHLDEKSVLKLAALHPDIVWIVPKGVSKWFHRRNLTRTIELGCWDSVSLELGKVTAVPAQHFSGRTLWDKNKTHWNGYVVERG
jgi:N-acyl-phosphatidylethanolamine-hydrolysing phospholipase D